MNRKKIIFFQSTLYYQAQQWEEKQYIFHLSIFLLFQFSPSKLLSTLQATLYGEAVDHRIKEHT